MAEISAGLVKELRELTGLGMMECKKALAESGGDIRKAEELLRIRSGAKASKAASSLSFIGFPPGGARAPHATARRRINPPETKALDRKAKPAMRAGFPKRGTWTAATRRN